MYLFANETLAGSKHNEKTASEFTQELINKMRRRIKEIDSETKDVNKFENYSLIAKAYSEFENEKLKTIAWFVNNFDEFAELETQNKIYSEFTSRIDDAFIKFEKVKNKAKEISSTKIKALRVAREWLNRLEKIPSMYKNILDTLLKIVDKISATVVNGFNYLAKELFSGLVKEMVKSTASVIAVIILASLGLLPSKK